MEDITADISVYFYNKSYTKINQKITKKIIACFKNNLTSAIFSQTQNV